ncbi:hypothetical protein Mapa_007014 [Marchantia paleacea]|nr:hypothetical protein Mapa_007014 [Marchantia paleacea]
MADAIPTIPAIREKIARKGVAWFPPYPPRSINLFSIHPDSPKATANMAKFNNTKGARIPRAIFPIAISSATFSDH